MKHNLTENDLMGLVLIGLGVTFLAVFSVFGGFSNITGMVIGDATNVGDTATISLLMFLIAMTIVVSFLAIYFMRKKR